MAKKDIEEQLEAAQMRISEQMKKDTRYKTYFSQYRESSVDHFIKQYARHKANLEVYGDYTQFHHQRVMDRHYEDAWVSLKDIQYKKLFDMECRWRAEEVRNLAEVEISYDFQVITNHILDYEGIPPVSKEDITLYQEYLRKPMDTIYYTLSYAEYPDYISAKKAYEEEGHTMCDYADFHNTCTGRQRLLLLPDIRGKKEMEYLSHSAGNRSKAIQKKQKTEKPYLSALDDDLIKFAEKFGDKKTANFIKDWRKWLYEKPDLIFEWAFEYLHDVYPEKVPIKANGDWKEALYFAAVHHKRNKTADILPTIHEEYLMKRASGIPLTTNKKERGESLRKLMAQHILDGREAKGEPRNFDF